MNTDTNHLILRDLAEDVPDGYELLPKHLNRAAKKKLNGNKEAYVSFTSGGKLSKHAAGKRKKARQKAKAARRANRKN